MGLYKTGNNSSVRSTTYSTSRGGDSGNLIGKIKNLINFRLVAARVTDIILDENHPKFNSVGQWNGIGAVYYEFVNQSGTGTENYALPYDSQLKTYPLVNEIVLMFSLPNQNIGKQGGSEQYFYLKPLGLWNHPHHDAYPNVLDGINDSSQIKDYGEAGRRVEDGSTEINLNSPINPSQNTFVEKADIKPLMPFMGDSLMEGRYGQSIRFGSTAKSQSEKKNNWSESGNNGDPILIIRNGQPEKLTDDRGWIPITEDLNKDLSSIYLTSKQKIPFSIANENFSAYDSKPLLPSLFTSPQIILNSDRIILNAKTDSVLISGEKSVGLSSNKSINLEAEQVYIDGIDIRLGGSNAKESVLLGDKTTQLLGVVIKEIINLSTALLSDPKFNTVATSALTTLNKTLVQLDSIKSNFVKTS